MERDLEIELVARLRAGDASAFDGIFRFYNARIHGFLRRMSRSVEAAEDLTEETWLRLVESGRDLAPDTRLGPWLFAVARNLYVSYCRSRARHESYTADLVLLWPVELVPSPFDAARLRRFEERIESALAELPPLYREALLLVSEEDLRPADAAVICGVSPEAFRQRLSRARAMISRLVDLSQEVNR